MWCFVSGRVCNIWLNLIWGNPKVLLRKRLQQGFVVVSAGHKSPHLVESNSIITNLQNCFSKSIFIFLLIFHLYPECTDWIPFGTFGQVGGFSVAGLV